MEHLIRINKFLSTSGYCSRREADQLIADGKVSINGQIAEVGMKIHPEEDHIEVNGKTISEKKCKFFYSVFHKPIGVECITSKTRNSILSTMLGQIVCCWRKIG